MSDNLCEINIADIDLTDLRYKISFPKDDISFLAHSIKLAGLVNSPVVRLLDNSKYIIVSGFNRVRAMLYNHRTKIVVYKTKPEDTDYHCLLLSIINRAFKNTLTLYELVKSVTLMHQFLDKEQINKKAVPVFNTELSVSYIKDLLTIGALPDPALELIHYGTLCFASAKRIALYETDTINLFLTLFSQVKMSKNNQLETIQYIMEISARDKIKPEIFFQNQEMKSIIFNKDKEPGLKTRLLREYLFKERFPALFKTYQNVKEKTARLKFGNNITFSPPKNFESQNFSIFFYAKNYSQFKSNVQTLNAALDNQELKEIFNQ